MPHAPMPFFGDHAVLQRGASAKAAVFGAVLGGAAGSTKVSVAVREQGAASCSVDAEVHVPARRRGQPSQLDGVEGTTAAAPVLRRQRQPGGELHGLQRPQLHHHQ